MVLLCNVKQQKRTHCGTVYVPLLLHILFRCFNDHELSGLHVELELSMIRVPVCARTEDDIKYTLDFPNRISMRIESDLINTIRRRAHRLKRTVLVM